MSGDKATGFEFGVQQEAPAGYTVNNPVSTLIRAFEDKPDIIESLEDTEAAEAKAATVGIDLEFGSFDAYKTASNPDLVQTAINYQKAASAMALVADIEVLALYRWLTKLKGIVVLLNICLLVNTLILMIQIMRIMELIKKY